MASRNVNNKQSLDLLLKCALCNGDLVNNQPKSLPCLHTFCTPCLTNERQRFVRDANIFKCPVCRSSEDSEITNNLELDVIIGKLLHVRHLQQSKRHCEMCPEEAVSNRWCLDCGKFLCDSCLVHHGKYKPNDKIIDLSKGMDSEKVSDFILPTKCRRHEEQFKMYCAQCKICLCSTCSLEHLSGGNANCALVAIEKVAPDTKSEGQKLLEETYSRLEEENQQIEGMKLKIADLKRQCSEKSVEIWEHTEETVRRLKANARVLIDQLEAVTKSEINELEKLVQLRQDHVKEIEILDNNFRQLLHSFDNVDILLNYARLKSKCDNLLMKHKNDVPSPLYEVNMVYNFWYLKTHEMSKNVPLGSCWKDSKLVKIPRSWDKRINTKQASNVHLRPFVLPPVPYISDSTGEVINEKFAYVSCIFVTDENNLYVGCGAYGKLRVYNNANELIEIHGSDIIKHVSDLCRFSLDKICIVDNNLILLQMNKKAPFLTFFDRIKPDVEYCSICNCFGKILVCDYNCCVHLLNEDGTVRRTVLDIKRKQNVDHKIRCGPFRDTFLLLDNGDEKLSCYSLDGSTCLFSLDVEYIHDLCTDKYGNIYVARDFEVFVLNPDTSEEHMLFHMKVKEEYIMSIFIKDDIFYLARYDGDFDVKKMRLHYRDPSN